MSKTFSDINHTNVFSGQIPKAIEREAKISTWDLIKLTSFSTAKETIQKMKRQPMTWGKNMSKQCDQKRHNFQNI